MPWSSGPPLGAGTAAGDSSGNFRRRRRRRGPLDTLHLPGSDDVRMPRAVHTALLRISLHPQLRAGVGTVQPDTGAKPGQATASTEGGSARWGFDALGTQKPVPVSRRCFQERAVEPVPGAITRWRARAFRRDRPRARVHRFLPAVRHRARGRLWPALRRR